ncbi:armadillo-type protein [Pisolithus croceorrhizus]|nr:armadillo-type protein [Pisolithus croceorrhizus]
MYRAAGECLEGNQPKIKQEVLVTLASPFLRAGGFFAQVVAAIACVELLHDQWPDLIELLGFVNNLTNANLRIATLKNDWLHLLRSNEILTAMICGVRHHEPSSGVQLAAAHAPYNSLEFVHENFEREGERNHIMQVMCEATQNPLVSVQVGALECLVKIMALYMEQALLVLTVMVSLSSIFSEYVLKKHCEMLAVIVCEEGIELAHETGEAANYGEPPKIESKFFAKIALPEVNPILLSLLTLREEIVDENERNTTILMVMTISFYSNGH